MQKLIENYLVGLILVVKLFTEISYSRAEFNEDSPTIVLFYSPLNGNDLIREQIVIYWNIGNFLIGDKILLYYGHPGLNGIRPIYSHELIKNSGVVKTGILPRRAHYGLELTYVEQCTGYYGTWSRNNSVQKMSCLSTHPDWMSQHKNMLRYMTLGNLFIPGTHNSGSYSEEIPQSTVQRYTVTQDRDVFDQLISGARYLDIRPCIYDKKYWACHGTYLMQPLRVIIDDINDFLENTDEIVIISFKEFPRGFKNEVDHVNFITTILKEFDRFLFPRQYKTRRLITLGEIWDSQKRLIVSYDHHLYLETTQLWGVIIQEWGDVKTIQELEDFTLMAESAAFRRLIFHDGPNELRATMAEVTLNTSTVIMDAIADFVGAGSKSLREMAVQAGPYLTTWYDREHYMTANILVVDFIDATGIVEIAIKYNKFRASKYKNTFVHNYRLKYQDRWG